MVAFGFLPQNFGGGSTVVGILKPYHLLKNLFELTAFKGSGDAKALGASARTPTLALPPVGGSPRTATLTLTPTGGSPLALVPRTTEIVG